MKSFKKVRCSSREKKQLFTWVISPYFAKRNKQMRNVISTIHFSQKRPSTKKTFKRLFLGSRHIFNRRKFHFGIPILCVHMFCYIQLMLRLDNWRLICIPYTYFLLQFILNLTFSSLVHKVLTLFITGLDDQNRFKLVGVLQYLHQFLWSNVFKLFYTKIL